MIQLPQDFKEFLKLLNSKEVEYLVIGGYAIGYYGYPRATGDLDIWVAINESNAQKLFNVLKEFGFNSPDITESIFKEKDKVIRMGNPPLRIEILTSISGIEFEKAYKNRKIEKIEDISVNFIGFKDLIKNKKASGRHKDLDDVEHLS
ncbi:MAG: nucleotidyltransferase [Elusimicrobia bacterium]|nr:nucleotidyltransferase [Candidatus Liberimonas magnetica]